MATKKPVSVYSGKLKELQSGDVLSYDAIGALATARLVGRTTAGTGALEAISIGSGLSLSAGTLSATGGGLSIGSAVSGGGANRVLYEDGSGNLATSANFTFDGTHTFGLPNSNAMRFPAGDVLFLGQQAGDNRISGAGQIAIGYQALHGVLTGNNNIALGSHALTALTSGGGCVGIGEAAGSALTTQSNILCIGSAAGQHVTGAENIFIGATAGQGSAGSSTGDYNVAVGSGAMAALTTGTHNVAIGRTAFDTLSSGGYNVAIGVTAGGSNNGSNNVFLGRAAGYQASGSGCVMIGYFAGQSESGSNKLFIENSSSSTPLIYGEFDNDFVRIYGNLHVRKTTEQQRIEYDGSNYYSTTVSSAGAVTFDAVGSGAKFTFSDDLEIADAKNLVLNSTTGTKIGTATTQKLAFYNSSPIVQVTTGVTAATFTANSGTAVNDASTFDGYTIGQIVKALRNYGLLA